MQPATLWKTNISADNAQLLLPGTEVAKYLADSRKLYIGVDTPISKRLF